MILKKFHIETDKIQTIQGELFKWRPREAQAISLDLADRIPFCSRETEVLTHLGLKPIRHTSHIFREANLLYSETTNVNISSIHGKHPHRNINSI